MITSPNRFFPALILSAGVLLSAPAPAAPAAPVLKAGAFKHHVETFNADDDEPYANAISSARTRISSGPTISAGGPTGSISARAPTAG